MLLAPQAHREQHDAQQGDEAEDDEERVWHAAP
jgi:hypothetical protein